MAKWKKRKHSLIIPTMSNLEDMSTVSIQGVSSNATKKLRKKYRKNRRKQRNVSRKIKTKSENISDNGFSKVSEPTPFDKNFDVETNKAVSDMQVRFNLTSDDKRRITFQEKYGIFGDNYDVVTGLLGNDLYRMLKETQYLDSSQIMDLVFDYNGITDAQHMEKALLDLIGKINSEYIDKINRIKTVMSFGHSFDESEKIVRQYVKDEYISVKGYAKLKDILDEELDKQHEREILKQSLWEEFENEY